MFHHRIENGQQFPHAGGQGYLFGFASRTQALVECSDHRIEAGLLSALVSSRESEEGGAHGVHAQALGHSQ
jgi:hypothetical protein